MEGNQYTESFPERIQMSEKTFFKLSEFIQSNYGIKLPLQKKILLEGRLMRRLRALNLSSFDDYFNYVFRKNGINKPEVELMINEVSTNKTDFFRENKHFIYLREHILPNFAKEGQSINIWSSACSSGEEVYTLTMVLEEFNKQVSPVKYQVLGTDISTKVLKQAQQGVYQRSKAQDIPLELLRKYFLKNKNDNNLVRVNPLMRSKVSFAQFNLLNKKYQFAMDFDIIFCRNVLIYFKREDQIHVIKQLVSRLKPGGWLFLGHSESLGNIDAPIRLVIPTVFQKDK